MAWPAARRTLASRWKSSSATGLGVTRKVSIVTMAAFRRQMHEYMHRLEVAGMPERRERLGPQFKVMLEEALES